MYILETRCKGLWETCDLFGLDEINTNGMKEILQNFRDQSGLELDFTGELRNEGFCWKEKKKLTLKY